jgi:hypothetical protein
VALIDLMKGRNLKKLFIMKKYLLLTGILFFYQIAFSQNVGINTATPTASLDVNGDVVFRTATLIVADGITLALDVNTTKFSYYRMEGPTANFTLAGIAAGADGRLLTLFNRNGFTMQLNNEDVTAAPSARIVTGTNAAITIPDKGMVSLQFDGNEGRWIVRSSSKGGGGGGGGYWDISGTNIFNTNIGNVGIGTNNPLRPLTVKTATDSYGFSQTDGTRKLSSFIGGIGNGDGAYFGTESNHPLYFYTNNSTPQLTIKTDGNIGIGTTTPVDKLVVKTPGWGLTQTDGIITVGTWVGNNLGINGGWVGTKSAHPLNFFTANGSAQMTLLPSGNFGIGTATPSGRLQIDHPGPTAHLILSYPGLNDYSRFLFANSGTSRYWGIAGKSSNVATSIDRLSFYTSTGVEPMVMTGDGYVTVPGKMGIGTVNSLYKFSVNGTIRSTEVIVENGWADYVFDKKYKLKSLEDVEKFIEQNKHLPGIPSATEIQTNGLKLGEVQSKMMQKIEELTLYIIEQNKRIELLEKKLLRK